MKMNEELFNITTDEKKALLQGIADVTAYIRKSNIAFGQEGAHRVYIEIPGNWYMVIDIANMYKVFITSPSFCTCITEETLGASSGYYSTYIPSHMEKILQF